jgi:mannitol/fructose-specific phosphotransferase system IIA component (Ntr-type)
MDLLTLTRGRNIRVGLQAQRKEDAIELLLDCLLEEGAIPTEGRGLVLDAIMRRERRLSTGLERGIAIPHGTTEVVPSEVGALGVFPDGVPFESVDDHETRIVILLVTPPANRHKHVVNLAKIAAQLLQVDVRQALLSAQSRADALAAIREGGA